MVLVKIGKKQPVLVIQIQMNGWETNATKPYTEAEGYTYSIIFTPKQKYPHIT